MGKPRLKVQHQLLKKDGKVRSRRFRKGGQEHFNVRLFVKGDVDKVEQVDYELHPTFREAHRVVEDPSNGFALDIWTWGEFTVPVTMRMKDGSVDERTFELQYANELPPSDDDYTDEGS